jgi:hypothetical protein
MKANSPSAYTKAKENGWLDDYTWFDEKPRLNYQLLIALK